MSFLSEAKKCVGSDMSSWHAVEDASKFDITILSRGVVVVFADWSGPAQRVLRAYASALRTIKREIPLYVVNIDTLTPEAAAQFPELIHANGETYFVKEGLIVSKITRPGKDLVSEFAVTCTAAFPNE